MRGPLYVCFFVCFLFTHMITMRGVLFVCFFVCLFSVYSHDYQMLDSIFRKYRCVCDVTFHCSSRSGKKDSHKKSPFLLPEPCARSKWVSDLPYWDYQTSAAWVVRALNKLSGEGRSCAFGFFPLFFFFFPLLAAGLRKEDRHEICG